MSYVFCSVLGDLAGVAGGGVVDLDGEQLDGVEADGGDERGLLLDRALEEPLDHVEGGGGADRSLGGLLQPRPVDEADLGGTPGELGAVVQQGGGLLGEAPADRGDGTSSEERGGGKEGGRRGHV